MVLKEKMQTRTMKLRIGKTNYVVEKLSELKPTFMVGYISPQQKSIKVAVRHNGRARSEKKIHHTLWHEIVHGMLWEAGSNKWHDEVLVNKLAKYIQQVNKQLQATQES